MVHTSESGGVHLNITAAFNPRGTTQVAETIPECKAIIKINSLGSSSDARKDGEGCSFSSTEKQHEISVPPIPIYVRVNSNDIAVGKFSLDSCAGYYTFAAEVRRHCPHQLGNSLPHASWPWAPRYPRADYFWTNNIDGCKTVLDPLTYSWDSFSSMLQYVVMYPDLGGDELIALTVYKGKDLELNLRLTRSIVRSTFEQFQRAVYFYYQAYIGEEPKDAAYMPIQIWPMALSCSYLDGESEIINFPGDDELNCCDDMDGTFVNYTVDFNEYSVKEDRLSEVKNGEKKEEICGDEEEGSATDDRMSLVSNGKEIEKTSAKEDEDMAKEDCMWVVHLGQEKEEITAEVGGHTYAQDADIFEAEEYSTDGDAFPPEFWVELIRDLVILEIQI